MTDDTRSAKDLGVRLPEPKPEYDGPHQAGIADPRWPADGYPPELPDDATRRSAYDAHYRGTLRPQKCLTVLGADVAATGRDGLRELLVSLSRVADAGMRKPPSREHMLPFEYGNVPESYRATVAVGFGASLFLTPAGHDRFGIRHRKPRQLRRMPRLTGDHPDFRPEATATDLCVIVASDHPYVNVAITRGLVERFRPAGAIVPRWLEEGFSRPDRREFLRFDDGLANLKAWPENDLDRLTFVDRGADEPAWCAGGSYLAYRKIRENLPLWEAMPDEEQERRIGRRKKDGVPLSAPDPNDPLTPVFAGPTVEGGCPLDAHIRKVQPRRPGTDLFGVADLDRRFLRRAYPFFDGLDPDGTRTVAGLQFLAFMRDPAEQFEFVTHMWQHNPHFPQPGTGPDALLDPANPVLSVVGGGYYFCPPAPRGKGDYLGRALVERDD